MEISSDPQELYKVMRGELDKQFPRVSPMDFYSEIFPEGTLERRDSEDDHQGRGITLELVPSDKQKDEDGKRGKLKVKRAYVFDGLDELKSLINSDHTTVMAPMTYWGKARSLKNAHTMHAITIDLDSPRIEDGVGFYFFYGVGTGAQLAPTFTVLSGHGLHLYYLLEEPLPMYPANQQAAQTLKRALTKHVWTSWTSTIEKPQIEGINQGFRLVGGVSKLGRDYPVLAWRTGAPVTLDQLTDIIRDKKNHDAVQLMRQPRMGWDEAAAKYPDWAKRIKSGSGGAGVWPVKRALYDWWRYRAPEALYGHRYFYLMCLAIYAKKCAVPKDEAMADAYELVRVLNTNGPTMSRQDVEAAFRAYDNHYLTFPRKTVEELTAISIPPNKRNGRTQAMHLLGARALQNAYDPEGKWRNRTGAPTKKQEVNDYADAHPEQSSTEVAHALGITTKTVRKYLPADASGTERVMSYVADHPRAGATEIARALGLGRSTVYRALRQLEPRTSKEEQIANYLRIHPDANPTEIARATGISRPTVYKYLKDSR